MGFLQDELQIAGPTIQDREEAREVRDRKTLISKWNDELEDFFADWITVVERNYFESLMTPFRQTVRIVSDNRDAITQALQRDTDLLPLDASVLLKLLARIEHSGVPSLRKQVVDDFKYEVLSGGKNRIASTEPGVRILLDAEGYELIKDSLPSTLSVEHRPHAIAITLPRGGYDDAIVNAEGIMLIHLDHETDEQHTNAEGRPLFRFTNTISMPVAHFVAAHGTSSLICPDFYQNPKYYPDGEPKPVK